MPKNPSCTGAPMFGAPIQVAFTYPAITETTGLSIELPTSEPTEAQVSYTIAAEHCPTITGANLQFSLAPSILMFGRNTSASSATISYRTLKNGVSVKTGTYASCSASYYFALSPQGGWAATVSPAIGDTLSNKLWANTTGVQITAHALKIVPTRVQAPSALLRQIEVFSYNSTAMSYETTPTKPSFGRWGGSELVYSRIRTTGWDGAMLFNGGAVNIFSILNDPTYGIYRVAPGDYSATMSISADASINMPMVYGANGVTKFTFLPLNIKL